MRRKRSVPCHVVGVDIRHEKSKGEEVLRILSGCSCHSESGRWLVCGGGVARLGGYYEWVVGATSIPSRANVTGCARQVSLAMHTEVACGFP